MPYIYKIENQINHKVYIGKTLYTIERRYSQHLDNAKRSYLQHLPLYAAMIKYGVDNFKVFEVEYVENYKELSQKEIYWVKYFQSYEKGYNATRGGDGSLLYDYEIIWDFWESGLTIKEISEEVGCNDFVVRTVLTLHNISTEERKERSYYRQLDSHRPYQRPVYKIDPNTNKILEEFESVSSAARSVNGDNSTLSKICDTNKIGYGFRWKYKEQDYVKKDFSPKAVCQLDLKTREILQVFPSISAAARAINGDSSYLSKVCRGIQKSSKGFGWCYLSDIH